jgi:alkaline phosphatase
MWVQSRNYILGLWILIILSLSCVKYHKPRQESGDFHNVIVLIPDGCGVAHMTIARWFKGAPLVQDSMNMNLVRTYSANSMITGSAAAATAFSTGYKTWEDEAREAKCLSLRPDSLILPYAQELTASEKWRPVATVLEGARLSGRSVGLVATCHMSHATPAAYASHWYSRNDYNIIMEQMVYHDIDVVFGGGSRYLFDVNTKIPGASYNGARQDGDNLCEVLESRGYKIITKRDELYALDPRTSKVWGMFAPGHMVHDIDRQRFAPTEPSLAEMTSKAIEILSKNSKGFFLMVEGSQVDWSSHDNDPVGVVTEYIAFDEAVGVALEFAKSHPTQRTLVLLFPDHDCGGMSLGHRYIDSYTFRPQDMINVLREASLTADGVEWLILNNARNGGSNLDSVMHIVEQYYGIADLTDEETEAIMIELADTPYVNLRKVIGPMLSSRAGIGWTTFDHTGDDVPMFSYGLDRIPQTLDNTDIAPLCASAMGFNLHDVTEILFADASALFGDAKIMIDTLGVEMSKGHLTVLRDRRQAVFPFFKSIMIIDQDTIPLPGITVYSLYANRVFLPKQAAELFYEYQ